MAGTLSAISPDVSRGRTCPVIQAIRAAGSARRERPCRRRRAWMPRWTIAFLAAALLASSPARAGEWRLGLLSMETLAGGGWAALSLGYRPDGSSWQLGWKYSHYV